MLDRVHLMRVFDWSGLEEAVEEISHICTSYGLEVTEASQTRLVGEVADSEDKDKNFKDACSIKGALRSSSRESRMVSMLVVDQIANVLGAELLRNHVQGMHLLTQESIVSPYHLAICEPPADRLAG